MSKAILQIHPLDNVAVALRELAKGECADELNIAEAIPAGHKVALRAICNGEAVIKYGYPIGVARREVRRGEHVHVHNVAGAMVEKLEAEKFFGGRDEATRAAFEPASFEGFRRANGAAGIRNEIWIINTVACVNQLATRIAERATNELIREGSAVEGIFAFPHPYGCSQLGDDLEHTQRLLAGLAMHPNAAGVLVIGLGCENNRVASFLEHLGGAAGERVRYFNAQEVGDELETGLQFVRELAEYAGQFRRKTMPVAELILGMKCGGSDGLSGITANPLVGRVADRLAALGGTSILTEVPEMFGAERCLLERAADAAAYDGTVEMINGFREYFRSHNQAIDENPSPGNKDGGITTLAEKSLGCVQKAGGAAIRQVQEYGRQVQAGLGGIALLNAPGNDGVSGTALSAAGAHMVLFTTGRGTPMGFPVPTVKISTNTSLAERKPAWIDFNAGTLADGTAEMNALAEELFKLVLDVASGRRRTRCEVNGYREVAIWKDGMTL